jgi:hypothetical protein
MSKMIEDLEYYADLTREQLEEELKREHANRAMGGLKKGAGLARHTSKQDYATPREFLDAVKRKFDVKEWRWDLAAVRENAVVTRNMDYFGPDHTLEQFRDALAYNWAAIRGDLWLNPPYADIAPWAAKCDQTVNGVKLFRGHIFFLVPASVGSNWWADHVHNKALVEFPRPRLSFDGKNPYPKDIALAVYGETAGYETWTWKESTK